MYLKTFLAINSGPLSDSSFQPVFTDNGNPKPIVLVGRNGSGKTNILSIIADGLVEVASLHYTNVMPTGPDGSRKYFRVVGASTIRTGDPYELCALRFEEGENVFSYRSKAGSLPLEQLAERLVPFPGRDWPTTIGNFKNCNGPKGEVPRIIDSGCYVFFPSSRTETPHWANTLSSVDPSSQFADNFSDRLRKPIVVTSSIEELKPFLIDVILDQSVDASLFALDADQARAKIVESAEQKTALNNFNAILRLITRNANARFTRSGRSSGNRKIQIHFGQELAMPTLNSLSSGQSTLLSIFGTIARYADSGTIVSPLAEMTGIVLIDEIDQHLHADLQHEVLPALIRAFPKIQFIVTSHSPLFPLGMERVFGQDGFVMLEVPSMTQISAERFSEFAQSFSYFQATKAFEKDVRDKIAAASRPIVLCEGQSDPIYLRTAAELLAFPELLRVDFDWVGQAQPGGAQEGGKDKLAQAAKLLRNNPHFVRSPTVLLFDSDAARPNEDSGNLHIRTVPVNELNNTCPSGIENLLPEAAFEDEFYSTSVKRTADVVTVKKLNKMALCAAVCDVRRNPEDFEAFRPVLEMLVEALGIVREEEQ